MTTYRKNMLDYTWPSVEILIINKQKIKSFQNSGEIIYICKEGLFFGRINIYHDYL